jgi:multiple sugar transport system permease protein
MKSEKPWALTRSTLIYAFLFFGSIIMIMPFYWTLVTSVKTPSETATYPIIWIPSKITFQYYVAAWHARFPTYYLNSIIVAVVVTLSNVYTSALAGFIFAKYKFPGRDQIFVVVLATMMVPFIITLIPAYYLVAVWLHLKDTLLAMILPALISPFGIFLMKQFAESIPDELIDAARIDGASDERMFVQLILPLCTPALSALAIFHFIWIWNDFLWPLLVTDSDKSRTLPIGVTLFAMQRWLQTNQVVAASVLVLAPLIMVYFIFQRAFVQGIVLTGMKY